MIVELFGRFISPGASAGIKIVMFDVREAEDGERAVPQINQSDEKVLK